MGDTKLCLMLILSAVALAHADDEAPCLMAKRYKPFHKYEYLYEAESLNFLNGAVNGPKGSCKVEIEVPGPCHYIVRTTECTLSEVTDFDAAGNPVFAPATTADAFKAAMEKNPLKVTVEGDNDIKLFPEDDEPINILNIKRGIISAFAVPVLEEERNKRMPTIYGLCKTGYTVNAREDIATDVTLTRDLSSCDQFKPVSDHTSPLALITGMNYPLSQLIRSTQTCNYQFDNAEHHPVSGECTENHILVPFSHKGKYGVTNIGKQKATLLGVTEHNDRVFDPILANEQTLHPHASVDKSPIQDKDAALALLTELAGLSKTENGHKRAHLAHKIVSMIRKMSAETLAAGVPKALEISRSLIYQALFQCGTPECNSAIMQILRTFDSSSMEIDATVYAMGLLPNPSRQLVHDMLEMAKFKQSKPIFYGASNAVKRLYKAEGKVTPEIEAVADFALEQIGDCTGDQEHIYMSLKVIGNMAAAIGAASPALKSAVIQCVNQPAATPEVQLAAIQAYRQTTLPEEGREVLMQVLLDGAAPLQKRLAAYLVLMKDPQPSELSQLAAALPVEDNQQAKSFVISHVTNILSSTAPETKELRQKILDALQGNDVGTVMDPTKFSGNYKVGSLEGNMVFEGSNYLPKEVMLEMTLNAFGYDLDMFEIGMEGKGLEPTVGALFGDNGFFPDTVMKTIYFAADRMPGQFKKVLKNILPFLRNDRKKRQASQSLIKELGQSVNKLFRDLKAQDAPEAMVYLKMLGMELGYLKTKDMEKMAYSAAAMIDNLLKMFPSDFIKGLLTSADNDLFAHYIFMDNEFYLPTGPGVPLRVALSGTFTPGFKGGVNMAPDMSEVTFMPSAGIEFVTEVGAHLPDFVQSGLEMHTNIYHESGLKAKVSVSLSNIKLTIPAPQSPTKLVSLTNSLVSVHGAETKTIPATGERVDVTECTPVFAGMKYCTALQYSDAMQTDESPYFPFTGDSKLAIEFHPTGEVSEYTADIDYSYEERTDEVKLTLKAEGAAAAEATANVKFNRKTYNVEADLQIPDYDLEVGLRLGSVNPDTKGKATHSVQIDLVNKNIPQASLIALGKFESMKDANMEVQLLVPPFADFKVAAHLHREEDLTLELKTDFKLPDTNSVQEITLKYDNGKLEAEIKSDVSSEIRKILSNFGEVEATIDSFVNLEISQTGMTVGTLLSKSVKETNAYIEKYGADIPYVQTMRVPEFPELSLPEKLYLKAEADVKYHFGKDYISFAIPLPLGGKSSGDLNFPAALTTPHLTVPQLGLEVASFDIPLPEVFVPEQVYVSLGKAEVYAKIESNFYNVEADVSAGRDPVDHPSYSAKVEVTGTCPAEILSLKIDGSVLLEDPPGDSVKAEMKTHVNHKLIDASITVEEVATIADKFSLKSNSKIEVTSLLGVEVSMEYDGDGDLNTEGISGNGKLEASLKAGPVYCATTISQTVEVFPFKPEAKIDSSVKIDSTLVKAQNTFAAAFANGELTATSNTAALDDTLVHLAEVTFKDSTLAVKSDTKAEALGLKIQNVAEASAGAGAVNIKVETSADHAEDRLHSLVSATLDVNGLAMNSAADVKLAENTATHKASLTLNNDGLATDGATSLQSPLTLENTFSGSLGASKAALNIDTKCVFADMTLMDFLTNFEITFVNGDAFLRELTTNYLPNLSPISPPEFSLFDMALKIPEFKMPHIPRFVILPSFRKLYGEVKVHTPIYNIRTTAEFQDTTDSETTPKFTTFLNSKGSSPVDEELDYSLDCTADVVIPKMSRIIIAETLKFTQSAVSVEHLATMTLYGLSAQTSARTTMKVNTSPYTADIVNIAFFGMEGGITTSFDTSYNHKVNIPMIYISDMSLTQKAVARQDGTTIKLSLKNEGTSKVAIPHSEETTHKSDLDYTMNLRTAKLTYTSDTESPSFKVKESLNADGLVFRYINFDARVEIESPFIKNSLLIASGKAHLGEMKVEIKANHDTELTGDLSGTLSNSLHVMAKPDEFVLGFQNKGNAKANLVGTLSAKLDLQNDYSVSLNYNVQHINTMALVKLNQYGISYNFTVDNNQAETGIYASVDGDVNLDILTVPISIPELAVPIIDFKTPAINDINLYEHTGLKNLLTSTEQTVDVDAKIVYKSRFAPLLDLGLIHIPAVGSLVSEASFKSSIINLNVNAEVSAEDDLVIRIGAVSASVFEGLKAKIDGTSSLTTKRGVKLATALSLENAHVEATHDSTLNLNSEASLSSATVAKVNLPFFSAEANHQVKVGPTSDPFVDYAFKMVYTLNLPVINAVGSGDVESSMKLEAGMIFLSMESSTKEQFDGTILGTGIVKRSLNDVTSFYFNGKGIRSTQKITDKAHVSYGDLKIEFDVDEDLVFELKERLYASMKIDSNNEINVANLNTKGKHSAKATCDMTLTSLAVDMEADLAQPSGLGDLSYFEKLTLDITNEKQKEDYTLKIVSPVYTTTAAVETEGVFPTYQGTFKATAKSPAVYLEYDLDGSFTASLENEVVSHTLKAVLTHTDLTMDVQHAIQHDNEGPAHTLNVDITSPTFTDVNFRYAARKDGASTSISSPSSGFLGFQLQGKIPQMSARLYCRYASEPENDVDLLVLKAALAEPEKMHLHASANMEAPIVILSGLHDRVPAITSSLTNFAEKYAMVSNLGSLKDMFVGIVDEAYNTVKSYTPEMSQLSILFRNVVVQYQKTVQALLDAAIKFLRETQIELPGMEKATLPEIVHKITTNVGTVLEQLLQVISDNLNLEQMKAVSNKVVEMVKNLESFDVILQKMGDTLSNVVQTTQTFVDSLSSDVLDSVFVYINALYSNLVTLAKDVTEQVNNMLTAQGIDNSLKYALESARSFVTVIINFVAQYLSDGKLDLELDFPIHQ
ncbi:apolipoprotein B-100-like [Clupea harengus]|uniref:Apolipoprotein B-100-like n=1 Tax=Clupea harengus TaxID=7950 RepID=A0A6P8GDH5_CLUHA|nr:apolipoprotein B-100-like [Clupea harengus]